MNIPETEKFYKVEECLKLFPDLFGNRFFPFYLPTEFVLAEPSYRVPMVARCYITEMFEIPGSKLINCVVDYNTLLKQPQFKDSCGNFQGTCNIPKVYCIELWEDYGSDGHVEFRHIGYSFFSSPTYEDLDPKPLFERMRRISTETYYQRRG